MKRQLLFIVLLAATIDAAAIRIDYSHPLREGVSYTGRTLTRNDGSVSYDWTGTYLQTDFTGGAIAIEISEKKLTYHNLFIDGQFIRRFAVSGEGPQRIVLADNLTKGKHRLRLQRSTEGSSGMTTVHAFYLARGGSMQRVEPLERFIEFYGDSYTCGYGTEAGGPKEHFSHATEDQNHSYASLIARYFDADYAVIAHSGQGMVRNYGDKNQRSKYTMLQRMEQVFDEVDSIKYDFRAYRPQLVCIQLGTNDFSRNNYPTVDGYCGAYQKFIARLRQEYGDVPILCILPYSAPAYLQTAFTELGRRMASDKHVYLSEPMLQVMRNPQDLGADWHPNVQGQRKIAMKLIPQISLIMNWDMPARPIE